MRKKSCAIRYMAIFMSACRLCGMSSTVHGFKDSVESDSWVVPMLYIIARNIPVLNIHLACMKLSGAW